MRSVLNPLIEPLGYQLFRTAPKSLGLSPFRDMSRLVATTQPVVFDVGANVGQTVRKMRRHLRNPVLHCFEPTPSTFVKLTERCGELNNVYLNNVGLADRVGELELHQLDSSEMNSFLPPAEDSWGNIVAREVVPVTTIDEYCAQTRGRPDRRAQDRYAGIRSGCDQGSPADDRRELSTLDLPGIDLFADVRGAAAF